MSAQCLITGCELVGNETGATAHGDLHRIGDSFVFNAVLGDGGETNWQHVPPRTQRVIFVDLRDTFERRGVIVFAVADARLSEPASQHIQRWNP